MPIGDLKILISQYQNILGNSEIPSLLIDIKGIIYSFNNTFRQLTSKLELELEPKKTQIKSSDIPQIEFLTKGNISFSLSGVGFTGKINTLSNSKHKEYFIVTVNQYQHKNAESTSIEFIRGIQKALDNVPDYVYLKDDNNEMIFANKSMRKLLKVMGLSGIYQNKALNEKEKMLSRKLFEYDESIISGERRRKKYFVKISSEISDDYQLNLHKFNIKLLEPTLNGVMCIGQNLNAYKRAVKKLEDNEALLNSIIESTRNFIWLVDRSFNYIYFNSYLKDFNKEYFNCEITNGSNALKSIKPENILLWQNWYNEVLQGEYLLKEYELHIGDEIFYYEAALNPIRGANGNVNGISVFMKDITPRKKAENELKMVQLRFRQLSETINDAFILWSEKEILYTNKAFRTIFDVDIESLKYKTGIIVDFIIKKDRKRYKRNLDKEIGDNKTPANQQYTIITPQDSLKKVWIRHYPVNIEEQLKNTYITVVSDLTEQRRLEDKLNISLQQQRAVIDNIPYYAWLKDKDGNYLMVNEPFASHYSKTPADMIGKSDFDICQKDLAIKYDQNDKQVIAEGRRHFLEEQKNENGDERWIETYKAPIFNDDGIITGITGIARDITDRKRMEKAIVKNEEHFRSLLQYSSDSITILNERGIITFESSLHNRISEFKIDELLGKSFEEIIHPDDMSMIVGVFNEVLKNPGLQIKKEYRSLHKNRKWIYVESIFLNQINNPAIKGIVVNTRDVSDRKMSELKERAYHDNLIFLSNSALDLMTLADCTAVYKYITTRLFSYLQSSIVVVFSYDEITRTFKSESTCGAEEFKEELIEAFGEQSREMKFPAGYIQDLINHPGVVTSFKEDIADFPVSVGGKQYDVTGLFEKLNVNKTYNIVLARDNKLLGNITILTLSKSIVKFKHIIETFVHQVGVALHRNVLEAELFEAKTKAEESDKLKTAFLANMSHEIRTPMNGILGFAEMLNDDNLPDQERKHYLDIINNNGKVLINLIDDIIDFAKIEAEQLKILKHDFSLNVLLSQIHTSFLNRKLSNHNQQVELKVKKLLPDDKSYINTDPTRLRQVLTNLIGNALKFTSEGYIEFGYSLIEKAKYIKFYVKDTGIGIPSEKLTNIFDRFEQADSSRTRRYSGSGLGLAISKGIIELLGGRIWVESIVDSGSTFYFTIPYISAQKSIEEEEVKSRPKKDYNWEGKTFLIAEDDLFSFKFLEGFLTQSKATIIHAKDGSIAVKTSRERDDIDLILMDVQMPEMNGMDATREIKKFKKKLPIIAQTANAIAEEKQKCFEAGFDDFVTKPINISNLFVVIDKWLHAK